MAAKTSKAAKSTKASKSVKIIKTPSGKRIPTVAKSDANPYRVGGGYWASVEALRTLGMGKLHDFAKIVPAVQKAMGENFKEFAAKKGKLSADERILMNVVVTSRDDYGKP